MKIKTENRADNHTQMHMNVKRKTPNLNYTQTHDNPTKKRSKPNKVLNTNKQKHISYLHTIIYNYFKTNAKHI